MCELSRQGYIYIYIYDPEKSPATVQGCIEILSRGPPKNNVSAPMIQATPMTTKTEQSIPTTNYFRASAYSANAYRDLERKNIDKLRITYNVYTSKARERTD